MSATRPASTGSWTSEFYETAAAGIGEALIKNDIDLLTARVGIAYRYDAYELNPPTPNVNSAAADFELNHDLKMKTWELVDKIVFLPHFRTSATIDGHPGQLLPDPPQEPGLETAPGPLEQLRQPAAGGLQEAGHHLLQQADPGLGPISRPPADAARVAFRGRHRNPCILVPWYMNTKHHAAVQRVQTGVGIEKRTLKVLKGIAELKDLTVGDLLLGILLHVYEGKLPFD